MLATTMRRQIGSSSTTSAVSGGSRSTFDMLEASTGADIVQSLPI
jgi:hypothetical protein